MGTSRNLLVLDVFHMFIHDQGSICENELGGSATDDEVRGYYHN